MDKPKQSDQSNGASTSANAEDDKYFNDDDDQELIAFIESLPPDLFSKKKSDHMPKEKIAPKEEDFVFDDDDDQLLEVVEAELARRNANKRVKTSHHPSAEKQPIVVARRPTTIHDLPLEILVKIVRGLNRSPQLFRLRLVCQQWKFAVEVICSGTRSVILFTDRFDPFKEDLFMGQIPTSSFVKVRINLTTYIGPRFFTYFCQLFAHVNQLVLIDVDQRIIIDLFEQLGFWPHLEALSLHSRHHTLPSELKSLCLKSINAMTKLKRLSLNRDFRFIPSRQLIDRLEFLQFVHNYPPDIFRLPPLGRNCTGLRLGTTGERLRVSRFSAWLRINSSAALANITHLSIGHVASDAIIEVICAHFPSLQVLAVTYVRTYFGYIDGESIRQLATLKSLTKLSLSYILLSLEALEDTKLKPLVGVRELNFQSFQILEDRERSFTKRVLNANRFSFALARVFPDLQHFGITYSITRSLRAIQEVIFNNFKLKQIFPNIISYKDRYL